MLKRIFCVIYTVLLIGCLRHVPRTAKQPIFQKRLGLICRWNGRFK